MQNHEHAQQPCADGGNQRGVGINEMADRMKIVLTGPG